MNLIGNFTEADISARKSPPWSRLNVIPESPFWVVSSPQFSEGSLSRSPAVSDPADFQIDSFSGRFGRNSGDLRYQVREHKIKELPGLKILGSVPSADQSDSAPGHHICALKVKDIGKDIEVMPALFVQVSQTHADDYSSPFSQTSKIRKQGVFGIISLRTCSLYRASFFSGIFHTVFDRQG